MVDVSHCVEPSRLHDYWIRRHLNLGGRSRTVVAAVSLPAVRLNQLHNRRSVASHQFPFSAIEDAFLPVLHPVTDHSNDLGRIVMQSCPRFSWIGERALGRCARLSGGVAVHPPISSPSWSCQLHLRRCLVIVTRVRVKCNWTFIM
ncbi:uncharacterized protein [Dermacentor albipictus]|uniref:uncharacterized protein isoform X2 n=1 Tax=Dermacentor albipictus TaxID=60249 RepID=UPI0038FD2C4B